MLRFPTLVLGRSGIISPRTHHQYLSVHTASAVRTDAVDDTAKETVEPTSLSSYENFLIAEDVRLFQQLIEEAHFKHHVNPFVPHQLPPPLKEDVIIESYKKNCTGSSALLRGGRGGLRGGERSEPSTAVEEENLEEIDEALRLKIVGADPVPPVYLCRAQKEWFTNLVNRKVLLYPPKHDPPPLRSTGDRSITINAVNRNTLSEVPFFNHARFNDRNLKIISGNRKKVPKNLITLEPSRGELRGKNGYVLSEAAVHALSSLLVREQIPSLDSFNYVCGCCGRPFVNYHTMQKHLMARHLDLYLEVEKQEWKGMGDKSGIRESVSNEIEKKYCIPKDNLKVDYSLLAEGDEDTTDIKNDSIFATGDTVSGGNLNQEAAEMDPSDQKEEGETALDSFLNSVSPTTKETKLPTSAPKTEKEGKATGKVSLSSVPGTSPVQLPEEALIDTLLVEVWDTVAATREDLFASKGASGGVGTPKKVEYFSASATVTEKAGRKSTLLQKIEKMKSGEGDDSLASAKATPEGVTPGIKNRRLVSVSAARAVPGVRRTVREKSKDYPNPFGETTSLPVIDLEREPVNPFVNWEAEGKEESRGGEDNHPTAFGGEGNGGDSSEAGNNHNNHNHSNNNNNNQKNGGGGDFFSCPFCSCDGVGESSGKDSFQPPQFRLLDNLLDHVEEMHPDVVLSSEELARMFYSKDPVSRVNEGYTRQEETPKEKADSPVDTESGKEKGTEGETVSSASTALKKTQEATPTHCRMYSNIDMIGTVQDIQEGFLKEEQVLQLILRMSDSAVSTEEEDGEEYITVQCVGTTVPRALLRQQLSINSVVYVRGLLKMNRRYEAEFRPEETTGEKTLMEGVKKRYAFPYIKVRPPFGYLQVL